MRKRLGANAPVNVVRLYIETSSPFISMTTCGDRSVAFSVRGWNETLSSYFFEAAGFAYFAASCRALTYVIVAVTGTALWH